MKRFILSFALLAGLALPATAAAQTAPPPAAGCQFVLGFKTLHDLAANTVGDCTDNQAFVANGDAQQHTSKGLLAWRKSDNWTAFTDGYKTWINGPDGLVSRLNTERLAFEKDPIATPTPAPAAPAQAPAAAPSGLDVNGGWKLENNNAIYKILEDDSGYVYMQPNTPRQCTAGGQATIDASADFNKIKSPMNTVFTGTINGGTITGNWLVCATLNQSWVPQPIVFTVAPDGRHMSGQLQETLTFDRVL